MAKPALGSCGRWVWLGAITALGLGSGCRSDDAGSSSGLATTHLRSNRIPQQRVKDPGLDDAGEPRGGELLLHQVDADAGTLQVEPLQTHLPLEADHVGERDATGFILEVEWKPGDWPAPSGAAESSLEGLEEARSKTRLRMRIEVAQQGRLNITFLGQGFAWPEGTELRARADRYGQLLVFPDKTQYRNVVPGALRALFSDRRLDLGPLFAPKQSNLPPSQWLGLATARTLVTTPVAEMALDQATIAGAGLGGALLCRLLIELAGAEPDGRLCHSDLVPLHAQLTNAPGGKLAFSVTAVGKKQDLDPSHLQVPPDQAVLQTSGMPNVEGGSIERSLLDGLRHRTASAPTQAPAPSTNAPRTGLVARNGTSSLRALVVDGIAVAWLASGAELTLPELANGVYSIAWRDFFGTFIEPSRNVTLPARVTLGNLPDSAN